MNEDTLTFRRLCYTGNQFDYISHVCHYVWVEPAGLEKYGLPE